MKQPYIRQGQIDSAFFLCWLFVGSVGVAVMWVIAFYLGWTNGGSQ